MVFSWGGNPGVGSLHRFREAYEQGWPRPLEIEEHSHAAMANAYEAGAAGLPFAVFRGYRGAELPRVNPNIKSVTCPYTGEVLATVPAIRLDSAIIHAQKADRAGNVLLEGIVGVQKEAVLSSKRSLVTVEEIVDDLGPALVQRLHPAALDGDGDRRRAGRRASLLHAGLLQARQRLLRGLGRHRPRPRQLRRLDGGQRPEAGPRGLRPLRPQDMTELDHIAVVAPDLAAGVAWVRDVLGVEPPRGGKHPQMGTHNCICCALGEDVFLEVIAVDPDAPKPAAPPLVRSRRSGRGASAIGRPAAA